MTYSKLLMELYNNSDWIEIVSYGLAPNPNGFCYEVDRFHEDFCPVVERDISKALEQLTKEETEQLKNEVF